MLPRFASATYFASSCRNATIRKGKTPRSCGQSYLLSRVGFGPSSCPVPSPNFFAAFFTGAYWLLWWEKLFHLMHLQHPICIFLDIDIESAVKAPCMHSIDTPL